MIMGTALEVSKLVIASFLYRNWKEIPILLRVYFSAALFILMLLTSMSVFGYLSKAHMDSSVATGDSVSALAIVDERITTEKENIRLARTALSQMDNQVNEMLSRTNDEHGTDKASQLRKRQKSERTSLNDEIRESQTKITKLQNERAPLASTVRKVEAEVGPIRYIANIIYGDKIDDTLLERAVRIVIMLIVSVFDPEAVLLLIAGNWSLKHYALRRAMKKQAETERAESVPAQDEKVVAFKEKLKRRKSVIDEFKTDEVQADKSKNKQIQEEKINETPVIDILRNETERTTSDADIPNTSSATGAEDTNKAITIASEVKANDEQPHVHIK